jgi:hypothetical protein
MSHFRTDFVFLIICDVYLNPWTLVLVLIVPDYALDPMYVWIPGYIFLWWSYLPIDRILRHSDLVKSKNTPANLKCMGGHRNRTVELREAMSGQDVVQWKVSRFLTSLFRLPMLVFFIPILFCRPVSILFADLFLFFTGRTEGLGGWQHFKASCR